MSRLPRVTGRQMVTALAKAGFATVRVTGSHVHLRHAGASVLPSGKSDRRPPV